MIEHLAEITEEIEKIKINNVIQDDLQTKLNAIENPTIVLEDLSNIIGAVIESSDAVHIHDNVYHDLEIFKNYTGSSHNTIFSKLNLCHTIYGQYYLQQILSHPSIDIPLLIKRQDTIKSLVKSPAILKEVSEQLQL